MEVCTRVVIVALALRLVSGQLCRFGYPGQGCIFTCNCKDNDLCEQTTGACPKGCVNGNANWLGPGLACQRGNVAYLQLASQSGDLQNGPNLAVDGSRAQGLQPGTECATPSSTSDTEPAWWRVDLLLEYAIDNITVLERNEGTTGTMVDWYIRIGSQADISTHQQCAFVGPNDSDYDSTNFRFTKTCGSNLKGRYVSIQKKPGSAYAKSLYLCEVVINGYQVFDCGDNTWGPGCLYDCHCDQKCDYAFGTCPGNCLSGWTGTTCQTYAPTTTTKKPKVAQPSSGLLCFAGQSQVTLESGQQKTLNQLSVGDRVMAVSPEGAVVFSAVIMMMHADPHVSTSFVGIKTDQSDSLLKITREHLIYTMDRTGKGPSYRQADHIKPGDSVFTAEADGTLNKAKVTSVEVLYDVGAFAPLTTEGTIVVNGVAASCYAYLESHSTCHAIFWPVRVLHQWVPQLFDTTGENIHWYAGFVHSAAIFTVPAWIWPDKELLL